MTDTSFRYVQENYDFPIDTMNKITTDILVYYAKISHVLPKKKVKTSKKHENENKISKTAIRESRR